MKIRLIGLGKMGANLALNFKDNNIEVLGYDLDAKICDEVKKQGISTTNDLNELLKRTNNEQLIIWLLIPNQFVDQMINTLLPHLKNDDIIIDGGNSNFNDSIRRFNDLKEKNISFVDLGTSGGTSGARNGACLMVGGTLDIFLKLEPIYQKIAVTNGYGYMGAPGAGHFVKMVHNGIEYGMMQAIAEGFDLLNASSFDLDYQKICNVWNHGSIIESALIGYTENAFKKDANLASIAGKIDDSGEGMWMIMEALKHKVAMPTIAGSLFTRYKSKDQDLFAEKVVAAMRNEFGGHAVYKKK